jgi:hypothetical protein
MSKSIRFSAIAAAATLLAAGSAFSQTVKNGTFDGPDEYAAGGNNLIADWQSTGYVSTRFIDSLNDQFGTNSVSIPASPGGSLHSTVVQAWFISGSHPTLSQSISGLTIGNQYTVSFDDLVSNRSADAINGAFSWSVSLGGETHESTGIAIPKAWGSSDWLHNTISFTATSTTEVLKFLANSTIGVAPEPIFLLDNVSISNTTVAAVPEPETYALMLAGLGLVGFAAKRRKAI